MNNGGLGRVPRFCKKRRTYQIRPPLSLVVLLFASVEVHASLVIEFVLHSFAFLLG